MKSSDINNAHINDLRPSGIIIINKEKDFTSHDCVSIMRGITGIKKIGHAGTLDPMAEGVLPICIGSATRIMEYLQGDTKEYKCTMKLGVVTDTMDIWGEVTEEHEVNVSKHDIKKAIAGFYGEIEQMPPLYSAIKVNGKRLYKYAREGVEVKVSPRRVTIFRTSFLSMVGNEVTFSVECSKGTYVRSLCNDIGRELGCGACMSALTRTRSGVFRLEDALTVPELRKMSSEEVFGLMKAPDYPLIYFGNIEMNRKTARDLINGKIIMTSDVEIAERSECEGMYRMYHEGRFIGTAQLSEDGTFLTAHKVFYVCI